MLKHLATASALALATIGTAQAGSLEEPVVVAPPAPVYVDPGRDWSGAYAGVNGTYGSVNFGGPPAGNYYGIGVHAGYLADMGNVVFGGEVSYEYIVPDIGPANVNRFGADVILGYDAGDFMPHVTAGVASLGPIGGVYEFGWSAGAGASVMLTDNVMLTGRYRYTRYNGIGGGMNAHAGKLMISYKF